MRMIVGAYAISPAATTWDKAAETALYDGLKTMRNVRGLEVPFTGTLHRHDESWLFAAIDKSWDFVVTLIPGTMGALQQNPKFGLASADTAGRKAAIDFARSAREAVGRLNQAAGRNAVIAVEVQSAPSLGKPGAASSVGAFAESLGEITCWDWQGARITIEHCDALKPTHPAAKGFLPLAGELKAIEKANGSATKPIGVAINWGRSVLETRRAETGAEHVAEARKAGALSGIMFSGASGAATPYGAWEDSHMPHAPAPGLTHAAEGSLLTEAEIRRCFEAAAGPALDFVGAKISVRPADAPVSTRLGLIRDLVTLVGRNAA
jgi:hypothetical protein